jgi:hypothetical protein
VGPVVALVLLAKFLDLSDELRRPFHLERTTHDAP